MANGKKMDNLFYDTGLRLFWNDPNKVIQSVYIFPDMSGSDFARLPVEIKQKLKGKKPTP